MNKYPLILITACLTLFTALQAAVIVSEDFTDPGTGGNLTGTTAEDFAAGITTAGGSSTWVAGVGFNDDGSTDVTFEESAYLNLGSYINDSKGTASGFFTASVTISGPSTSGSSFYAFGFFASNTPDEGTSFYNSGADGAGVLIYRDTGELDGFAGPRNTNNVDGPDAQSGSQNLSFDLDLRDWNGTDHWGSITFYDGTGTSFGSFDYTADQSYGSIGLTLGNSPAGQSFSNFQLVQVPEPSSAALLLLAASAGAIVMRRRRK